MKEAKSREGAQWSNKIRIKLEREKSESITRHNKEESRAAAANKEEPGRRRNRETNRRKRSSLKNLTGGREASHRTKTRRLTATELAKMPTEDSPRKASPEKNGARRRPETRTIRHPQTEWEEEKPERLQRQEQPTGEPPSNNLTNPSENQRLYLLICAQNPKHKGYEKRRKTELFLLRWWWEPPVTEEEDRNSSLVGGYGEQWGRENH